MANHKSAKKRAKQNIKKNALNKSRRSEVRTAIKGLRELIASKDKAKALEALKNVQSKLGKLAKSSALKQNTMARKTSRLASQVASL